MATVWQMVFKVEIRVIGAFSLVVVGKIAPVPSNLHPMFLLQELFYCLLAVTPRIFQDPILGGKAELVVHRRQYANLQHRLQDRYQPIIDNQRAPDRRLLFP